MNLLAGSRDKTPDVQPERPQLVSSTPHSCGMGANGSFEVQTKPEHYKGYLQEDIKSYAVFPIAEYIEVVLGLPKEEWERGTEKFHQYETITKLVQFQRLLGEYLKPASSERERYPHFLALVEFVLAELAGDGHDFKICRNDPANILGSFADRSPDLVALPNIAFKRGERTSPDNLSKAGPTGLLSAQALHWSELLFFYELKAKRLYESLVNKNPDETVKLKSIKLVKPEVKVHPAEASTST